MNAELWGLLAGCLAVSAEIIFKQTETYGRALLYTFPLALGINFTVFKLVHSAPSLPSAFVIFSATTFIVRVGASLWLGHHIGTGTWVAISLLVTGVILRHYWP